MKTICCITAIIVLTVTLLSYTEAPKKIASPNLESKKQLSLTTELTLQKVHVFTSEVSSLSQQQRINRFNALKKQFKKSEFLVQYIDPAFHSTFLNGAPLPKIQHGVPDLTVIEPRGFQHLEELIYSNAPSDELKTSLQDLLRDLQTTKLSLQKSQLTDSEIFEAMRYGIITLNAMGITGFDSPKNPDKALAEASLFLNGIFTHFNYYKTYIPVKDYQDVEHLFITGIKQLENAKFLTFDRLSFLKTTLNPLYSNLLKLQQTLFIETPIQRDGFERPVNYTSQNLFDANFLNENFFFHTIFDGDVEQQEQLGQLLFFDPILSLNNDRACASCHKPNKAFTDGLPQSIASVTFEPLDRNSPTLSNAIYATRFFHDMRADDLFQQIDHVLLNPNEFQTNYPDVIEKLKTSNDYINLFKGAFQTEEINADKIKFALTSYLKSLTANRTQFDQYVTGEINEIDTDIIKGYNLFSGKAACATCHFAPTFSGLVPPFYSENESEVLGVPETKDNQKLNTDIGRAGNGNIREKVPFYERSFKTPSLRNVALTAPYMHNGVYQSLEEVMAFYNKGGGIGFGYDVPHQTLPADNLELTEQEIQQIILFMEALTDTTNFSEIPSALPLFEDEKLNNRKIGGNY